MDHPVGQRNQAAEASSQPRRLSVAAHQFDDLERRAVGEIADANRVDPVHQKQALGEPLHQPYGAQLVVADHVCGDVAHPPSLAQRLRFPLVGSKPLEHIRELFTFLSRHRHCVHGSQRMVSS
jgi:hypothetical protein